MACELHLAIHSIFTNQWRLLELIQQTTHERCLSGPDLTGGRPGAQFT